MPRKRNPNRDKAFEIYREHNGDITNRQIAEMLDENEKVVAVWKQRDQWNVVQQSKESCTTKEISWVDIENEYVTDIRKKPCTLETLAKKYGISHGYLMQYAAEHDWTEKRRTHLETTKRKTASKAADIISSDAAKVAARHFRLSDKLTDVIEKALADDNQFYTIVEKLRTGYAPGEFDEKIVTEVVDTLNESKLLNVVSALDKIQKMQRQTLGIMDEKDKKKLELETFKALPKDDDEDESESDGFEDAWAGKIEEVWSDYDPSKES